MQILSPQKILKYNLYQFIYGLKQIKFVASYNYLREVMNNKISLTIK